MTTILIIEDDQSINDMCSELLKLHHFQTRSVYNGLDALKVDLEQIDLILLDLMLPGMNGKELIGKLKEKRDLPILVISALSDIDTKVLLFELGADDYITKPFDNKELLARMKTRLKKKTPTSFTYRELCLNEDTFTVTCREKPVNLSKIEFQLLKILIANPDQVFTKDDLIEQVWDNEFSADDNTLNVHISNIRRKLKKANPEEQYIKTIWNIGYKLSK